ncbi:hypothetical protein FE257_010464 [Aspergillus nanangensis]|uniref:Invertebrate defensins family profile domain-containing protein n=1 Tax=Aspergillus nanangensis TaxID=2582783 RepID=A0AAD4CIN7_ASPNN|nr:hypothetical protein FE257_010464 [Aspergillus nanangensis]
MHLSKVFVSSLLVALSSVAIATPTPDVNALEERSGWTCNFLGDKGCQVKCVGIGKSGGYCDKKKVCTCHHG